MDDAELNAIRAARLAEIQKSASGISPSTSGSSVTPQEQQRSDAHSAMLSQILEPEARDRLSRVRIVRPDRAQAVEDYIVRMAQSGQLRKKVGEEEIVEILDGVSRDQQKQQETKIIFDRRRLAEDSEDDDFFD
ncbi:hypothetical protein BABINDRAFT_173923 [Babjeviella inositovora NRRL Y-12698]|uniref:DNA-binding TFAR19-related protein n=1 Tax=Babjeviella inositovora NRRL Y-12698 TaxID=984486 RepID=A0A1E3QZV4_9ASCO|nr:uncharacterized protein BABINDRAFT_173923 [Babjeviella inositovora NRRL Y-12698]ODQ83115.1 hypothetical protein BABINDRAFT_173923 [Babjeviella inositovora NRRL Y-12698]